MYSLSIADSQQHGFLTRQLDFRLLTFIRSSSPASFPLVSKTHYALPYQAVGTRGKQGECVTRSAWECSAKHFVLLFSSFLIQCRWYKVTCVDKANGMQIVELVHLVQSRAIGFPFMSGFGFAKQLL